MARLLRALIVIACFLYAGRAFAAGGACPAGANYLDSSGQQLVTLSSLGVTECFYIAANGSDSNSGVTESTPWAHLPGMPSCTGNCAAVAPTGGMGFIFRGGDTWGSANFNINWMGSGSSSNPVYIGVDQSWHSGGAWARPIWTCSGTACAGMITFQPNKPYNMIDNIEMTGWLETSSNHPTVINACGQYQIVEDIYFHGWTANISSASNGQFVGTGCGSPSNGTTARFNVADGSDTAKNTGWFNHTGIPVAYGNVMRYVVNGLDGCGSDWHDNLFEYMTNQVGGGHQDAFLQYGPCNSDNTGLIYNNVLRHTLFSSSGGSGHLWVQGLNSCGAIGSSLTSCVNYVYNNIIYDNLPGNIVDAGGHFAANYGTLYLFNNTFQCGTDSVPGDCELGDNGNAQNRQASHGTMAIYSINNQWISADKSPVLCCSGPAGTGSRGSCYSFTCTEKNALYQTVQTADAEEYISTASYAFQPSNNSGSTIGAGANDQSLCTAINVINSSAGAACQQGTSYACAYNEANHTVSCPTLAAVVRPSGPWDIGAYQFGSSGAQASGPKPPQGLTASIQ